MFLSRIIETYALQTNVVKFLGFDLLQHTLILLFIHPNAFKSSKLHLKNLLMSKQ